MCLCLSLSLSLGIDFRVLREIIVLVRLISQARVPSAAARQAKGLSAAVRHSISLPLESMPTTIIPFFITLSKILILKDIEASATKSVLNVSIGIAL